MNNVQILYPVFALAVLTFLVAIWMAKLRFAAVKKGDLNVGFYELNRGREVPDYLAKVSHNYDNLLELPILFYVVALAMFTLNRVELVEVVLAWVYVGSRYCHTCIHTTYNNVLHRMLVFTAGAVVLASTWVILAVRILEME